MSSWHFYPDNFSSYEDYVKYLKEKGFAVDAPVQGCNGTRLSTLKPLAWLLPTYDTQTNKTNYYGKEKH